MANPSFSVDDDKPLDPTLLRVQARLRRLILISTSTLAVGIVGVLVAIVYRITADTASAPAASVATRPPAAVTTARFPATQLSLPVGARLVSTAVDGSRVAYTYVGDAGVVTIIVDVRSGAIVGRVELGGAAPPTAP